VRLNCQNIAETAGEEARSAEDAEQPEQHQQAKRDAEQPEYDEDHERVLRDVDGTIACFCQV
jgi:hypothetical protein